MSSEYDQKRKVQEEYYDKTAANYDQWHVEPKSAKIVDDWNFRQLKKRILEKDPVILDLACGTGRLLGRLQKLTTKLYGVDQSSAVLNLAKNKFPDVDLVKADITDLPYDDDFFDVVVVNGSLHHFFSLDKTLQECYRILKPGGVLALLGEPNKRYHKFYNPFYYIWILTRVIARIYYIFKPPPVDSKEIEPEAEDFTITQLINELGKHGFLVQDIYCYDYFSRTETSLFLSLYSNILSIEHKTWARWIPGLGSAIQCFAIKAKS